MKTMARRDLIITLVGTAMAAVLCAEFDVSEAITRWARPLESLQLDEMPAVMLVLAILLCWFATRRYVEAREQLKRREAAEFSLAEALADNQRLARRYVDMQETERKALARDLHDELGQYLNAIKLDAVAIRDATAPQSPWQNSTRAMIGNIDRLYDLVRDMIRQLRPVALDTLGFVAATEHLADQWRTRLPAQIDMSLRGDFTGLDEARALVLYRIIQEALTNVARHASARHVLLEATREPGGSIALRISDDGSGSDTGRQHQGLGLLSMRERLAALGGQLTLRSEPGQGFSLSAEIPA